jgi:hypothetical protein
LLSERSSPEHDKAREEPSITTDLPGFCPAVWRPDVCRPLAALGPVPLSWSSGTLATERFYLPIFRVTNEAEPYSVIWFTNALPFYSTISTLTFLTAVKLSLAPKATDSVVVSSPCRPTPIATTALPFIVSLDADGLMEARLIA